MVGVCRFGALALVQAINCPEPTIAHVTNRSARPARLESWAPERTGCLQAVAICNIINGAEEWPSKHCPIAAGCKARGPSGSEKCRIKG